MTAETVHGRTARNPGTPNVDAEPMLPAVRGRGAAATVPCSAALTPSQSEVTEIAINDLRRVLWERRVYMLVAMLVDVGSIVMAATGITHGIVSLSTVVGAGAFSSVSLTMSSRVKVAYSAAIQQEMIDQIEDPKARDELRKKAVNAAIDSVHNKRITTRRRRTNT